ncbi:hypothetical protein ACHAWU_002726 [Discostella pseudostelligera]|uniref:MYND-type domain-containing protein n=1 Tax=Discostella pseudostelligera TaxID=259834 RepID=A0ABD3MVQ2_9STRA
MNSPPASSSSSIAAAIAMTTDGSLFTPSWCRSRRGNDVVMNSSSPGNNDNATTLSQSLVDESAVSSLANPSSSSNNNSSNNPHCWWQHYSCLVCGKAPPAANFTTTTIKAESDSFSLVEDAISSMPASLQSQPHKRCSRCHSAIYCSTECQRQDYTHGKHRMNCLALDKLWKEKAILEKSLWNKGGGRKQQRGTNPFDDSDSDSDENNQEEVVVDNSSNHYYPTVGKFWHDHPKSTIQKMTTLYCVTLLQLVQLLGRGEAWRVCHIQQQQQQQQFQSSSGGSSSNECHSSSTSSRRRGPGNPLARELAIDIAYTLLQLDQTDMRVRLLIPSLLVEGGYNQEAYDYLKNWLLVDSSLMIMDLALLGGDGGFGGGGGGSGFGGRLGGGMEEESTTGDTRNPMKFSNCNMMEPPEDWMDGEMVYPSVGMVFELAFLKCHLLCMLRSGQSLPEQDHHYHQAGDPVGNVHTSLVDQCATAGGEDELERQVKLLLSLVHKWNPHLLPKLAEPYDIETGASTSSNEGASTLAAVEEGMIVPGTPPALSTLLNKHPPGFELQYKMGNPGGGSVDEAVAIWQRDMILWHVVDPMAMQYLSNFCLNLEDNLVDTNCLNGGMTVTTRAQGLEGSPRGDDAAASVPSNAESIQMRKEAEDLAKELQEKYPDRTMDEIMMHPDMAQLMIKHLQTTK